MVKIGTVSLDNCLLGAQQIAKIIIGEIVVWENVVPKSAGFWNASPYQMGEAWHTPGTGADINFGGKGAIITKISGSGTNGFYATGYLYGSGQAVSLPTNTTITDNRRYSRVHMGTNGGGNSQAEWRENQGGNWWRSVISGTVYYLQEPNR